MLFLLSQKRRLKVKRFSRKTYFRWLKACTFLITFLQTSQTVILPPPPPRKKKYTQSLSTIIKTFEKHPSIFNIKKRKLDSVFSFRKTAQEEVSKVLRDLNIKKVIRQVTLPPKLSNWISIFSQIWFTNILTTALRKTNLRMIWSMLILFQYVGKITNAKKKTIDL